MCKRMLAGIYTFCVTSEQIVAKRVALIEGGMIKGVTPNCVWLAEHSINRGKNVWHLWTTSNEAILLGAGSQDQSVHAGRSVMIV
jgi:hypothetical protein